MVTSGIQALAHSPVVQQRQVKTGSGPERRELQRTSHTASDGKSATRLARLSRRCHVGVVLFGDQSDGFTNYLVKNR
jgi:hypothetical protein